MGKSLYLAECVKVAIFRQKHDLGSERGGSSALAGIPNFSLKSLRIYATGRMVSVSFIV